MHVHFYNTHANENVFQAAGATSLRRLTTVKSSQSLADKDNYPEGKCSLHKSDCHRGNMLILIMTRHRLGFIIWGEYVEKSKVGHGLQTERTERKKKRKLKEKAEEKNKKKTKKNAK